MTGFIFIGRSPPVAADISGTRSPKVTTRAAHQRVGMRHVERHGEIRIRNPLVDLAGSLQGEDRGAVLMAVTRRVVKEPPSRSRSTS